MAKEWQRPFLSRYFPHQLLRSPPQVLFHLRRSPHYNLLKIKKRAAAVPTAHALSANF